MFKPLFFTERIVVLDPGSLRAYQAIGPALTAGRRAGRVNGRDASA